MLTQDQIRTFHSQGWLVVPQLVPECLLAAVRACITDFLGIDAHDPSTWYGHGAPTHGILPLHQHPALWSTRQFPGVYAAFRDLYERDDLWVSHDRASFKPPARPGHDDGGRFHWDCNPYALRSLSIQGALYLTDTDEEQGAFACLPEAYRQVAALCAEYPDGELPRRINDLGFEPQRIAAPAGSLVLWHRLAPHTSTTNHGLRPRWVQYIAMQPAGGEAARHQLAQAWRCSRAPGWAHAQQVPGQCDPEPGRRARLTPLGRRLTGLDPWP